ncbi:MAG: glycosyltransferase [Bacteroidota bacterium]|nr:glycosyltransferase [Bacteroidota bacterium]
MIVFNYIENTITDFESDILITQPSSGKVLDSLFELAKRFPNRWIAWKNSTSIDWEDFDSIKSVTYKMLSSGKAPNFIDTGLGYVEDTPFINYSENHWYPTWIMSADQGMIHATVLNKIKHFRSSADFEYDINLLARTFQHQGILCYSNLKKNPTRSNYFKTYKLVGHTMKKVWLPFLLLCHLKYDKRFPFFAFAKAVFLKKIVSVVDFLELQINQDEPVINTLYDVIIPTMGRASYLYDVINDLANQTLLPQTVYIVEQNTNKEASTELYRILNGNWPFSIDHKLIHKTGACNARNIALEKTRAKWVLLFDDDARLKPNVLENMVSLAENLNVKCINAAYLQKGEHEHQKTWKQWPYFGSGCSLVHREIVDRCKFDKALEHGYGEDVDFGMQIRRAGYDVIYAPQIQILHLKAPVGGFREKRIFPWSTDNIQPKPSPHIMYFRKKNYSENQLKGYKLVQWFKNYGKLGSFLPWGHNKLFNKAWESSKKYANSL